MPRVIYLVHSLPGRMRLRLPWLRQESSLATPLADGLQDVPGIEEVEVRPFTGSVLCQHDPDVLDTEGVLDAVCRLTGVRRVVRPGEEPPEDEALLQALTVGSEVARATTRFVKGVNLDVLRATEGHLDLGMLVSMGFVVAGAAEVVASRKLPLPDWFNLAWWSFATFTGVEKTAIDHTEAPVNGDAPTEPPRSDARSEAGEHESEGSDATKH